MNYSISNKEKLTIEHMTPQEISLAIEWAQMEGWNPGIHDSECFYNADPNGFYVVKLSGEIVGTISLVNYAPDFCFEGLFIVKPEFRGRGIGRQVQKFALNICRNGNLGLDGVLSMQHQYEQYGLNVAYGNTRYSGTVDTESKGGCSPIKPQDFNEIASYDRSIFVFDRERFLRCWLFQKETSSLKAEDTTGKIVGYGVVRKCIHGYKIGPLFADDATIAERLFDNLSSTVNGETIYLDTPQPNSSAVALAERKGMTAVFSTVRMYTKKEPMVPLNRVFGVTSFELG